MTETFIIDWPVLGFVGIIFGSLARDRDWQRSRAFAWGMVVAVTFTGIAFVSYWTAPDWMWMYFLEPSRVAWALPFIALGYLFAFVVAFAAGVGLGRLSRSSAWGAATGCLALEAVVVAITWDRYREIGTRREWLAGEGDELIAVAPSGSARPVVLMGVAFLVVLALALRQATRGARTQDTG